MLGEGYKRGREIWCSFGGIDSVVWMWRMAKGIRDWMVDWERIDACIRM